MESLAITGPLGHIGSKLIQCVQPKRFKEVLLIDNLATQRYFSLFNLPQKIKFKFIEADICSTDLNKLFKGIDIVIHLAAITDAANSFNRIKEVKKVNIQGTKRVALACVKNKTKLLFPSTTSVYGDQNKLMVENCPRRDLKPQSPYAESKLQAESFLQRLGKTQKLQYIVFRFGTIFGISKGMRFHTAVNKFIWQAVMGQPITVWKTALNQQRPYLDINDAVKAIFFVIDHQIFNKQIYNVVTINSSVADIIKVIKKYIPKTKLKFVNAPIMNQLSYKASADKFIKLGFKFRGNLEKGIKETINLLQ